MLVPLESTDEQQEKLYTLGLGKEVNSLADNNATKSKEKKDQDPEKYEEYLLMKREEERKLEILEKVKIKNQTVQDKKTYTKPDRSGKIKQLYGAASKFSKTDKRQNVHSAASGTQKRTGNLQAALIAADAEELELYKGKQDLLALPDPDEEKKDKLRKSKKKGS